MFKNFIFFSIFVVSNLAHSTEEHYVCKTKYYTVNASIEKTEDKVYFLLDRQPKEYTLEEMQLPNLRDFVLTALVSRKFDETIKEFYGDSESARYFGDVVLRLTYNFAVHRKTMEIDPALVSSVRRYNTGAHTGLLEFISAEGKVLYRFFYFQELIKCE